MNHEISDIIGQARQSLSVAERKQAERFYNESRCTLLSQSPLAVEFVVNGVDGAAEEEIECTLCLGENGKIIEPRINGKQSAWDPYTCACLLRYEEELKRPDLKSESDKKYTREGMTRRVLEERREKAEKAACH